MANLILKQMVGQGAMEEDVERAMRATMVKNVLQKHMLADNIRLVDSQN